jgi:hypothetical protein
MKVFVQVSEITSLRANNDEARMRNDEGMTKPETQDAQRKRSLFGH